MIPRSLFFLPEINNYERGNNAGHKHAQAQAAKGKKGERKVATERSSALLHPPAFVTAAPPRLCPRYSLELEGTLAAPQTSVASARAGVHWGEASADGAESEEELEMAEGERNVELGGNPGLYCAMARDIVSLIDE